MFRFVDKEHMLSGNNYEICFKYNTKQRSCHICMSTINTISYPVFVSKKDNAKVLCCMKCYSKLKK